MESCQFVVLRSLRGHLGSVLDVGNRLHRIRERFHPSERGPSAPVPSIVDENWTGVDIMCYLDGRWRCQSLVYFGEPQDSSTNVAGGAFREARGYLPGPLL